MWPSSLGRSWIRTTGRRKIKEEVDGSDKDEGGGQTAEQMYVMTPLGLGRIDQEGPEEAKDAT